MNVFIYSGFQKLIEKSGVGRAIYHQRRASENCGIQMVNSLRNADLIHINTIFPHSIFLASLAHLKGIPVVYHAHSTKEDFRNSFIGSNRFSNIFGKWIKYCYEHGDVIITPTHYSKKLLESYGIEKPIEVISNGIDLTYYKKENVLNCDFRKRYGYESGDKVIMSVGLTIERKGLLDFVDMARQMPEYQFIWFGEANRKTLPQNIVNALDTSLPNLRFAGYVNKNELREAYASCDLFWFPTYEETEGIVVLEALAMKIPVLLRDIPVYEDWLLDGVHVYKAKNNFEFMHRIKLILENACDVLSSNGYHRVKKYSIEKVGMQLKSSYQYAMDEVVETSISKKYSMVTSFIKRHQL